jgi:pimeloyl-ACP methyl ester carboxylesterase
MEQLRAIWVGDPKCGSELRHLHLTLSYPETPETGHCPYWERPERVAADLDAFMQER